MIKNERTAFVLAGHALGAHLHGFSVVRQPTADVRQIDGELARYRTLYGRKVEYTFVDAESAHAWGKCG